MNSRDTILIVDDMEVNRAILRNLFENEYNLLEAENGQQAIVLIEQCHQRIAAVLLDLHMPVKNGYEVLEEIGSKGLLAEFPVVVITAEISADQEVHAFDLGVSDIIMKPFKFHVVKRRVRNIIELYLHKQNQKQLIEEQAAKLRESNAVMIDALSSTIEYRSVETGQHIRRIRMFTKVLLDETARCYPEYGLDEQNIDMIVSASSMHDIGKIAIPDSILNKPGRLTAEEFEIMKTHSIKGCGILAGLKRIGDRPYLKYAYNICRYHHERWDGSGYPDGLKEDNIPICAQVVGIADCYDALTTDRVYRKAISPQKAVNMILNGECGTFSPKLLECLKNVKIVFGRLTREYADEMLDKTEYKEIAPSDLYHREEVQDTLQLDQMKYFSLLRYLESTVMEVDLNTGLYHVLYVAGDNFSALKYGNCFQEAIQNFVRESVQEEDKETALEMQGEYLDLFFEEGKMRQCCRYRIFDKAAKAYIWCETTVLRIDTGNPTHKKALIIWKETDEEGRRPHWNEENGYSKDMLRNLAGSIHQCKNDRFLTMKYYNSGFINLFGYSEEEIEEEFGNRFIDMIYAPDREEALNQAKEQLRWGNVVELEYRVKRKDGSLIWILDKSMLVTTRSGEENFYGVLIDITHSRQAQEELRLILESHKIIMEQTNDIIFEWDMQGDSLSFSSNWHNNFGYMPIETRVEKSLLQASHVHPEDLPSLGKLLDDLKNKVPYREIELRITDTKGNYRWFRIRASLQVDAIGDPIKAIGVITDIDKEKRESQSLRHQAERDGLTGLYNKSTARQMIEKYLTERRADAKDAMLIIDVDDFKIINDSYGHMFGDVVLKEISDELRKLFRSQDIISRIGGDEFLIFMHNVPDRTVVRERADKIVEAFSKMFHRDIMKRSPSCSVGIAYCPDDGQNFEILYQHSDIALYAAKAKGKNCYMQYDKNTMDNPFGKSKEKIAAKTLIDSSESDGFTATDWMEKIFAKFYGQDDMVQTINSVLEMIGHEFGVSRVYIYEEDEEQPFFYNTFEWCNKGIASQKEFLRSFDYMQLGGKEQHKSYFDENGVFFCPDVVSLPAKLQGFLNQLNVKSTLQCAMRDNGEFKGFIGFDDCLVHRIWTKEQIDVLLFTANITAAFLLKARAQSRTLELAEDLKTILNKQNAWIYVVDPGTFRLKYINAKAHTLDEDAEEGMLCYEALFKRTSPCEICPLINDGKSKTMEIYNPRLNIWSATAMSMIHWGNKQACLITCRDITKYKTGRHTVQHKEILHEEMDRED